MNESSQRQSSPDVRSAVSEATTHVSYADLQPAVRTHVDNLTEQMAELVRKYGKKHPKELVELMENEEMSIEDVRKFGALGRSIGEMFEKNMLPKEMRRDALRLREEAERLFLEADELFERHQLGGNQLDALPVEDRISVGAGYLRFGNDKILRSILYVPREAAQLFALAEDYPTANQKASMILNMIEKNLVLLQIAKSAWKRRNNEAFETSIENADPSHSKDAFLEMVIRDVLDEKDFETAEYLAESGSDWVKRAEMFLTIAHQAISIKQEAIHSIQRAEEEIPKEYISDNGIHGKIAVQYARFGMVEDVKRVMKKGLAFITFSLPEIAEGFVAFGQDEAALKLGSELPNWEVMSRMKVFGAIAIEQVKRGRNSDKAFKVVRETSQIFSDPFQGVTANIILAQAHFSRGEHVEFSHTLSLIEKGIEKVALKSDKKLVYLDLEDFAKKIYEQRKDPQQVIRVMDKLISSEENLQELCDKQLSFARFLHSIHQTDDRTINVEDVLMVARETAERRESVWLLLEVARASFQIASKFTNVSFEKAIYVALDKLHKGIQDRLAIDLYYEDFFKSMRSIIEAKASAGFSYTEQIDLLQEEMSNFRGKKEFHAKFFALQLSLVNIFLDKAQELDRENRFIKFEKT